MHAILLFCKWCESTRLFSYISNHEFAFPALETIHLFGLTLLLGTLLLLCMRLLGVMLARQPVAELAVDLAPYTLSGLTLMVITGVLMFVATAVRCYGNTSFWVKMMFLAMALIFHFAYFRKLLRRDEASISPAIARSAAFGTLVLWFGVGAAGRAIGFFG